MVRNKFVHAYHNIKNCNSLRYDLKHFAWLPIRQTRHALTSANATKLCTSTCSSQIVKNPAFCKPVEVNLMFIEKIHHDTSVLNLKMRAHTRKFRGTGSQNLGSTTDWCLFKRRLLFTCALYLECPFVGDAL